MAISPKLKKHFSVAIGGAGIRRGDKAKWQPSYIWDSGCDIRRRATGTDWLAVAHAAAALYNRGVGAYIRVRGGLKGACVTTRATAGTCDVPVCSLEQRVFCLGPPGSAPGQLRTSPNSRAEGFQIDLHEAPLYSAACPARQTVWSCPELGRMTAARNPSTPRCSNAVRSINKRIPRLGSSDALLAQAVYPRTTGPGPLKGA